MPAFCERTDDLVLLENSTLRNIYSSDGAEACKQAARKLLIATAAMYSFVSGPDALTELFDTIQSAQSTDVLS